MFFLSLCCQGPLPCWESQSSPPPWMPSNTVPISAPAVGRAQILTWSSSCVVLPPIAASSAVRTSAFPFVGVFNGLSYIPQTQSLPSWSCRFNLQPLQLVGRFGIFFLSHTAPGFRLWLYFHSACGSSTGVCSWGCPGGLGFAPVRARGGGGAAAWVAGALAAPGTHGGWCLGQQEIQCSRGYGDQYWPICSSILVWRTPLHDREAWQATIHRAAESWTLTKRPCAHRCKEFLPVAALPQWALSKKLAQLLGLRGPRWRQVCRGSDCLRRRSYGHIRVFFPASCSWQSESLFGQSFSIDLPMQSHREAPLAGVLFCGSGHQALKGAPGWGPCSAVQCLRHLMGQCLYCPAVHAGLSGERGYGDGSTPYAWLSSITLLPWLPSFPPQAFSTSISSLTSPQSISPQSTEAPTLGLLYNPQTPAPSRCTFPGTYIPVWGMYGCSKGCLILIPFRLPQISCFTLSLKCFSFDSDNCPDVGMDPCFSSATHWGQVQSYQHSCFPPSSFILPSFEWFCIFFSSGLGLLSALSWCSACTSVSERVFLMYPWREMSTNSSSILFSLEFFFLTQEKSQESWDPGNPHWNLRPCISSFWHPRLPWGMNMGSSLQACLSQHKATQILVTLIFYFFEIYYTPIFL